MEKLILETSHRGIKYFHKLDNFPVIVGRSLVSDVIVSDITVSASHLKIDRTAEGFEIQNLSDENGTFLNNKAMTSEPVSLTLPASLSLGELQARVLSTDMALAPTRIRVTKTSWFSMLNNPFWAAFFVVLTIFCNEFGRYINTPVAEGVLVHVSEVVRVTLLLLGVTLLITSVSRLSTHRWAFIPALNLASLFLLLPILLGYLGDFLSYLLTVDWPSTVTEYLTKFLLLPALLLLYLSRVHYLKFITALRVALLTSMPVIGFFLSDVVTQVSQHDSFSISPNYNKSLSPLDIRLSKTQAVGDFLEQSQQVLDRKVDKLLQKQAR